MIAAHQPVQRAADARLLAIDSRGRLSHLARAGFVDLLRPHDLLVANDAATLPASLHGFHAASGAPIEVRLAGRHSLAPDDVRDFSAVVFGGGDFRERTEERSPPPLLAAGDRLVLGPLDARVVALLGHPRLVALRFAGTPQAIWSGLARHGRPIQYAHVPSPLALWDVWTPIASLPAAFEAPSAGFALDWGSLQHLRERGVAFATLTHAAGLSSTGDAALDARLPFDEPYRIPNATARAIVTARRRGGRIVAVGTSVVRALEDAACACGSRVDVALPLDLNPHGGRAGLARPWGRSVRAGNGVATRRIGAATSLRVVDAILSGTHEPGSSHYELLRAFADDETLRRAGAALEAHHYRTHEFGDSVWVERSHRDPWIRAH